MATCVVTDSREARPGALFVCVPGERVDGHDFAARAVERGAAAVLALQAGNDMVLTTDYPTQIAAVLEAVAAGEIDEAQIDASVRRVLEWKQSLGLLQEA